ncbi:hypothetical protein X975_01347, partial [Stegodyphus mimosarum]
MYQKRKKDQVFSYNKIHHMMMSRRTIMKEHRTSLT